MTLSKYALDYNACSITELQSYIKARSGKCRLTGKARKPYVLFLKDLDRDVQFRFQDLPPELRNVIYTYLLTWISPDKHICFPEILATSKQIYKEAKGVLYAENIPNILLIVKEGIPRQTNWRVRCGSKRLDGGQGASTSAKSAIFNWPEYLKCYQNISITVDIANFTPGSLYVAKVVNHVLYNLASSLVEKTKLQNLSIEVRGADGAIPEDSMSAMLWPITKLKLPSSSVVITGLDEAAVTRWRSQVVEPGSADNVLSRYKAIVDRTNAFRALCSEIGSKGLLPKGQSPLCRQLYRQEVPAELQMQQRSGVAYHELQMNLFMTKAREDKLAKELQEFDAWLRGEGLNELNEAREAEIKEIKAMMEWKATKMQVYARRIQRS